MTKLRIFTFFGNSNSGKTTLIFKILEKLKVSGYSTGYIKNSSKDFFNFESDGKDTRTLSKVSDVVFGRAKKEGFMHIKRKLEIAQILDTSEFESKDFILIEGNHEFPSPKILVAKSESDLKNIDDLTIGVCGPENLKHSVKGMNFFNPDDIETIANFIVRSAVPKLPNLNCGKCRINCRKMARLIALGDKTLRDCVMANEQLLIKIDGKPLQLAKFLENIVIDVVEGILKNLKGYSSGSIEIKINKNK